jgi:hypothetical protein
MSSYEILVSGLFFILVLLWFFRQHNRTQNYQIYSVANSLQNFSASSEEKSGRSEEKQFGPPVIFTF